MEDKRDIVRCLAEALHRTRAGYDAQARLTYDPDLEAVRVTTNFGEQLINVACDSGIALIRDVVNNIKL